MEVQNAAVENADFLTRLRTATSQSHKNLESLPVSRSILAPDVTRESYANYLRLMRDVIYDTETAIFPILEAIIPDLESRRKLQLIERDLHFLNSQPNQFRAVFSNQTVTPAFALGILYVVEGSTLGGRFILNNINAVLGFDENLGDGYFAGYGNKTGSQWKQFLAHLSAYERTEDCGEEQGESERANQIISGADFAFRAIHKHFS